MYVEKQDKSSRSVVWTSFNLIEIIKVIRFEFDLGFYSLNNQTSSYWLSGTARSPLK